MPNKFLDFVLDENVNNTMSYNDYNDDSQRKIGFQSGAIASSIRVNTALRQATLVACALMDVIAPNDSTVDFRSGRGDVARLINNWLTNTATVHKASRDGNGDVIVSTYAKQNGTYDNMTVGEATHATSADSATNATNASHATNADNATEAGHATTSDTATTATNATNAMISVKLSYTTTVPTSGNSEGLKVAVLTAEPQTKYNGWLYIITEA